MKKFLLLMSACFVMSCANPAFAIDPVSTGTLIIEGGGLAVKGAKALYELYQWWKNDNGRQTDEDLQRKRAASITVLMEAAHKESINEIAKLLKAGEIINTKDYDGDTALTYAIAGNSPEAVKFLVESGAYVNEKMLNYAVTRNDPEILSIILQKNFDREILNNALINMKIDGLKFAVVNELLKSGADINYKDSTNNETLLMKVINYDGTSPETVSGLIKSGANVSLRNSDGMNSLMYAAKYNKNIEITRVILKEFYTGQASRAFTSNKPSVNSKDDSGKTALMYAAEFNTAEIVNILIDSGADVTLKDREGNKAIDYALGWFGGNSQVKGTDAFERLGKSDNWFRPYW